MKWVRTIGFICVFGVGIAYSQRPSLKPMDFTLNPAKIEFFIPDFQYSVVELHHLCQPPENIPLPIFTSPVKHTALFCKMELKVVRKLGFWIKVHAGDYDAYVKGQY